MRSNTGLTHISLNRIGAATQHDKVKTCFEQAADQLLPLPAQELRAADGRYMFVTLVSIVFY